MCNCRTCLTETFTEIREEAVVCCRCGHRNPRLSDSIYCTPCLKALGLFAPRLLPGGAESGRKYASKPRSPLRVPKRS